jgi:multiple sugar transport system permease protein
MLPNEDAERPRRRELERGDRIAVTEREALAPTVALPARRRPGRAAGAFVPYMLVLPSFALASFIILYPLVQLAVLSTHDINRFGQLRKFSGVANLSHVLADPLFHSSLVRTLVWTGGVVAGTLLVSIPTALVLNERFAGRGLARVIVMLPWSISLTMTAVVWRWALNGISGLFNLTLRDLGLIETPVAWLADASTAFPFEILIGVLVSVPFGVTVLLGGLAAIPADVYEAASLEGAGRWTQFRTLTWPLLKPYFRIAVVINLINVFNSFPIIWIMTQGGPANSTDILVTYLYKLAFTFGRMGDAAVMSLVMFAILFVFTLVYLRLALRNAADA